MGYRRTLRPSRKGGNRRADERGAALVEMALALPLLLTILFGIIEAG